MLATLDMEPLVAMFLRRGAKAVSLRSVAFASNQANMAPSSMIKSKMHGQLKPQHVMALGKLDTLDDIFRRNFFLIIYNN